jgi:hypothetical protein
LFVRELLVTLLLLLLHLEWHANLQKFGRALPALRVAKDTSLQTNYLPGTSRMIDYFFAGDGEYFGV